jgi:HEAT repeat protein
MVLQFLCRHSSKRSLGYCLVAVLAVLIAENLSFSQYTNSKQSAKEIEIKVVIQQLESDKWTVRSRAITQINRLPSEAITDDIKANLLQLLAREAREDTEIRKTYWSTGIAAGEGHGEYVISFLMTVLPFIDEDSIPDLVQFLDWAPPIRETIVRFGEKALQPVLAKLEDTSPGLRSAAVEVLGTWSRPKQEGFVLKGIERKDIKNRLINKALNDSSPHVRLAAVEALAATADRDIRPVLEKIARGDPYSMYGNQRLFYPVREKAKEVLRRLARNK